MAALPGFLPGTLVTSQHGTAPGYGQQSASIDIEEYTTVGTAPVQLTTSYQTLLTRVGKPDALMVSMIVSGVGGAGSTVTSRLRPSTVTPAGTEYNLTTTKSVATTVLVDFLDGITSLVVPSGYVLEALAAAGSQLNVILTYKEPRHQ